MTCLSAKIPLTPISKSCHVGTDSGVTTSGQKRAKN